MWTPEDVTTYRPEGDSVEDRWIFSRLNACAAQVNRAIEQFRYHEAAQAVWHFFWHEFCDWYLELKKLRFVENSGLNADWRNLLAALEAALRLLHPVMPFLTEELWQRMGTGGQSIALAPFPVYRAELEDPEAEREIETVREIVGAARNLRADMKADPKTMLSASLYTVGPVADVARRRGEPIRKMANIDLTIVEGKAPPAAGAIKSMPGFDLTLDLPAAQLDAQRARASKEREQLEKAIANLERQLGDETFLGKAPEKIVAGMREKLEGYRTQVEKLAGQSA
jgi:valyl-tRNA synthetase